MNNFLGRADLPRGIRNNNPGNLRRTSINWQGKIAHNRSTDKDFEQFTFMHLGIRALIMDVVGDIRNDKLNTPRKLINSYAPPGENNTLVYINSVSKALGITPDSLIVVNRANIERLIRAIVRKENGNPAAMITDDVYKTAFESLPLNYLK